MKEVDWDSLYTNPVDKERDDVLSFIWKRVENEKSLGNPLNAWVLIQLAHDIEKGKHSA